MFGIADYGAFVVAFIILLFIPGPGNLAIITSTTKGGLKGGLAATLGLMAGDQVLMWLAVAGVAAVLAAYPTAFHAVQWLGEQITDRGVGNGSSLIITAGIVSRIWQ